MPKTMLKILTSAAVLCLTISTQALAAQDLYCSSNEVSATLFLHASKNQYVFKSSQDGMKVHDNYNSSSALVADNSQYSIQLVTDKQVLIKFKDSALEFILNCK